MPDALLQDIIDALNDRLLSWQATRTGVLSDGYGATFNAMAVVLLEVRPEFRNLMHPRRDVFPQEHALMARLESDLGRLWHWDEGEYHQAYLLGPHGIGHYLCRLEGARQVLDAVRAYPVIAPEERERRLAELRQLRSLSRGADS